MYTQNSTLKKPANSRQQLWRYMPLDRLLDLLTTEELFFTHLPAFTDGLEGALTRRSREHLANWFQMQSKSDRLTAYRHVYEYEGSQTDFYASCWHMNDAESYLMWKAYANRGYAIRTTFERVQASFEMFEGAVSGGVVNYIDFERDLTLVGNVFHHVATKDLPYKDEREFRLLLWAIGEHNQNLSKVPNGIRVKVNLGMLIESIFVSPFTRLDAQLENVLTRKGIPIKSSNVNHRGAIES